MRGPRVGTPHDPSGPVGNRQDPSKPLGPDGGSRGTAFRVPPPSPTRPARGTAPRTQPGRHSRTATEPPARARRLNCRQRCQPSQRQQPVFDCRLPSHRQVTGPSRRPPVPAVTRRGKRCPDPAPHPRPDGYARGLYVVRATWGGSGMTEVRPMEAAPASLLEREKEVSAVEQALDTLCADRSSAGGLLMIRGEAGLGKTALLAEIRRIAEGRGCTVFSARGGETLRSVPFNVLRQLLQPALVSLMPEEGREYLGEWYEIAGPALGIAEPGE